MPRRVRPRWWALSLLPLLLALVPLPRAAPDVSDTIQDRLRTRIEAARQGQTGAFRVGPVQVQAQATVIRYYQQTGFAPTWIDPNGPTSLADSLVSALRAADRDGLRPADYHVAVIDSLRRTLRAQAAAGASLDPQRLADFELLCTNGFLLYGAHLRRGRVDAETLEPTGTATPHADHLVPQLEAVLNGASLHDTFASLRPSHPEYGTLVRLLSRYRQIETAGGWPTVPDGPKLEVGLSSDRVVPLRRRLHVTGDLPVPAARDTTAFDSTLSAAVVRFQERHGLEPDGVVGPATRAALNVPVADRIQQLVVNLERWRWLPHELGDPHVRVNIAGFELQVIENGAEALHMRVVVGQPYRQTPVFSDRISYLVFSPYWNVPHSLAVRDKLPAFKANPSLVSQQGFEVLQGWGADAQPIDPSTIDWASLSARTFPYRLRQRPGPQNALGQVKFMFPNPHSVYLHDTPSRSLFARSERSFSSGCIRVERPLDLAAYLLRENTSWTPDRIRSAMGQRTEQTVVLNRKVPVHLLYWTAWAEDDAAQFRRDVYQRDAPVAAALLRPLPPPRGLSTDTPLGR